MSTAKSGVTVTLTNESGSINSITDSTGKATFSNVLVGTYSVNITIPDGYSFAAGDAENNITDTNSSNNTVSALPYAGIDVVDGGTSTAKIIIKSQHLLLKLIADSRPNPHTGMLKIKTLGSVPVLLDTTVVIKFGSGNGGEVVPTDDQLSWISSDITFTIPAGSIESSTTSVDFQSGNTYGYAKLISISNPNMDIESGEDGFAFIDLSPNLVIGSWREIISSLLT